jgi:hypothetical protein
MFETLFGSEMPLAARFFIAFLIVLALIGLTAWLVRRFGANRLGTGVRGRQPRLAVIDAATVDGRRRLVLIRRDNIEHLLMIGGPTDLVVEPNIVRAAPAREVAREPVRAGALAEPAVRPSSTIEDGWPLQPAGESTPCRHRGPTAPLQLKSLGSRRSQAHARARLTASPALLPNVDASQHARSWIVNGAQRTGAAHAVRWPSQQRCRPITILQRWRSSSKLPCAARRRRKADRR